MGRPSNRAQRRAEICAAVERVLAVHGLGGATITAIAAEAGVAPGLLHHHFDDREALMTAVVEAMEARFRGVVKGGGLHAYVDEALAIRGAAGKATAAAWVGLFAEAVRSRSVSRAVRRFMRRELARLTTLFEAEGLPATEAEAAAAGTLSCIVGCLVFGALMPGKAVGFAAPFVRAAVEATVGRA